MGAMKTTVPAFDQAIRSHDELIKRRDLTIWIGAEPTFTDRASEAPEWLHNALGPTKEARARHMLVQALEQTPGAAILRPRPAVLQGRPAALEPGTDDATAKRSGPAPPTHCWKAFPPPCPPVGLRTSGNNSPSGSARSA